MSTDKLWTVISGIEYQLNILKDKLKSLDEETKQSIDDAYQRGLDDAWEAAKKLFSSMADSDIEKAFPIEWNNGGFNALMNLQPQEAIEKLKAYDEKQKADDEIKVGDEVDWNGYSIVVTRLFNDGGADWCNGIGKDGRTFLVLEKNVIKTGRHFDISSILKEMQS